MRAELGANTRVERSLSIGLSNLVYVITVSPAADGGSGVGSRAAKTNSPRDTAIGAVVIVAVLAATFVAFDVLATCHLRRVVIASVRQHSDKIASVWALTSKQVVASTVCMEISGVASAIVGGLDALKRSSLTPKQEDLLVRLLLLADLHLYPFRPSLLRFPRSSSLLLAAHDQQRRKPD